MRTQAQDAAACSEAGKNLDTSKAAAQSYGRCALDAACDTYGLGDLCAQAGPVVDAIVGAIYDAFSTCEDCCKDPTQPHCIAGNNPLDWPAFRQAASVPYNAAVKAIATLLPKPATHAAGDKAGAPGWVYAAAATDEDTRDADARTLLAQALVGVDGWAVTNHAGVPVDAAPRWAGPGGATFVFGDRQRQQMSMTGQQAIDLQPTWKKQAAARRADLVAATARVVAVLHKREDVAAGPDAGGGGGAVVAVGAVGLTALGWAWLRFVRRRR